jgi:hypothetical protein
MTEIPIMLVNGGTNTEFPMNVERVDVKYNRDVFEYKRKEKRRVNDRGFIATVFVVTGWYEGESVAEAASFQATFRDIMKTWYDDSDTHKFVWSCGDGVTKHEVGGVQRDAWWVCIKSGDATQRAEYPHVVDWVMTLMEADG